MAGLPVLPPSGLLPACSGVLPFESNSVVGITIGVSTDRWADVMLHFQ